MNIDDRLYEGLQDEQLLVSDDESLSLPSDDGDLDDFADANDEVEQRPTRTLREQAEANVELNDIDEHKRLVTALSNHLAQNNL